MSSERSAEHHYVSLLIASFRKYPEAPAFLPYIGRDDAWERVTYREIEQRLVVTQTYWRDTLAPLNLQPRDVVGFWLTGRKLSDLLNTIAVCALGYVPQYFSGYFGNSSVVLDLLAKSGGKVFIVDPNFEAQVTNVRSDGSSVPRFRTLEYGDMTRLVSQSTAPEKLILDLASVAPVARDDVAALFHSSGTTGGTPKIIPSTFKMITSMVGGKWPNILVRPADGRQPVMNTLGNVAHIGSIHLFLGSIHVGACMVQTSSMDIPDKEFLNIVRLHRLSTVVLYATFLGRLINSAQQDPEMKDALKSIDQIIHTGVALHKEEEEWAYANGIKIVTSYGTTETAPLLKSTTESPVLYPIPGANPVFLPYQDQDKSADGVQLYEVVVPSTADDCPPPEMCGEDGYYHTNDLFEKVGDGWVYRGRGGDWIKILGGFCDTKNVEDTVRKLCSDLVHDVVMVGTGRLYPVLIVESAVSGLSEEDKKRISQEIVDRTAEFNRRLFIHERVEDPKRVFVVEKGTLPRTKEKGNIRRAATEELFEKELDLVSERA
ncbi:acetyl-CoA synthetase-like protein [Polyporus arcularius HHB13444]|uniref:Acetyl-CoA synthetase-like protein n=1 Tax=Polyporus arcularius HHB13444 TaxID=1314778 RepID=A0A5C3PPF2_9APHY|nr:acetyl-CoA synthetase-like protein [Polyporus arcularius HHB13444]